MKTYKPIDGREKAIQIAIGLFVSFIFAAGFSLLAPWIFTWIAGFFDSTPDALRDCKLSDYKDKTLGEMTACWDKSDSYEAKVRRLRRAIPWFWILFIFFGWLFLKNPLRGRMRDNSNDIIYEGEGGWSFLLQLLFQALFFISIWAFLARDKTAFIALGSVVLAILVWYLLHRFFLKKYGKPRSEYAKDRPDSKKAP